MQLLDYTSGTDTRVCGGGRRRALGLALLRQEEAVTGCALQAREPSNRPLRTLISGSSSFRVV